MYMDALLTIYVNRIKVYYTHFQGQLNKFDRKQFYTDTFFF